MNNNNISEKAKKILSELKAANDLSYVIVNDEGEVLVNTSTSNLQDIYGYKDFYGAYGDAVFGQIDSRTNSDDEILTAIDKLLQYGKPVKRDDLAPEIKKFWM